MTMTYMPDTIVAPQTPLPTPNADALPRRFADFATFGEALDYAAQGVRGLNFHDPRGNIVRAYPFSVLRDDALAVARRLIARGFVPGDRVALVAETGADFAALFCGSIYAGVWPVPLPLPTSFGGRDSYIDQIAVQMASAEPQLLLYPAELASLALAAAERQGCEGQAWEDFLADVAPDVPLPTLAPEDICFLQYSSGSTRFPHGVAVTHRALLHNLAGHGHGMKLAGEDRCISWLPWYHDMGLVGCFLSVIANQVSTDYLKTEDFARRPLAWLDMISRNPGTSVSYSPTFGYDICARRISSQTSVAQRFDLSRWRLAGNGADMIRPDVMQGFVDAFADAGFRANAFMPSYGLAEATLAVTLMPPGEGIRVELVEEERLSGAPRDLSRPARYRAIVNCGKPVRGMEVVVRGEHGDALGDHVIGKVWCRGDSVMHSYYPRSGRDRGVPGRRLAGHRRHGLPRRRLPVHRRPGEGHDHHQRQEPLAAGYRVGGGTAARLPPGRHRRLRGRERERGGSARGAGPLPRQRSRRAPAPPCRDPRQSPLDHRHELRGRTGAAQDAAPHELGQAQPRQGKEALPVGRDRAVPAGGMMRRAALAITVAVASAGVPAAASARTYLASIVGLPLRAGEFMEKFSIDTWSVEVVAVCHFPPGWRLTVGKDASPDGIIAGEGSHGVAWLDRQRAKRELADLLVVRFDGAIYRQRVEEPGGAYRPASFNGTALFGAYGSDAERTIKLTYANLRLVPAAGCPRAPARRR